MFLTDLASDMATSRDLGIAEGRAEGIEKVARNALMNGFSIDQIHLITGLDTDTIKKLGASANSSL
jgi:predicted transposase YdaD